MQQQLRMYITRPPPSMRPLVLRAGTKRPDRQFCFPVTPFFFLLLYFRQNGAITLFSSGLHGRGKPRARYCSVWRFVSYYSLREWMQCF